jgi:phospholipid/cholesterol/gamma-HCH transport system substrate-binding protein
MRWTFLRVAGVAGLALAVLVVALLAKKPFGHKTIVKAYFVNAMSLRAGAPVRLAGVDIGSVESVRARPELKVAPAEVIMVLTPSYEVKIPNDAIASLETEGVLGQTYVDIDARHASGALIGSNAVLQTLATPQVTTQEVLEKFSEILSRKCDCASGKNTNTANTATSESIPKNGSGHAN